MKWLLVIYLGFAWEIQVVIIACENSRVIMSKFPYDLDNFGYNYMLHSDKPSTCELGTYVLKSIQCSWLTYPARGK